MNPSGIIRRVDDLGRIVIPKDLRERLNIKEGDAMEIFFDNDTVAFKKYQESKKEKFHFYKVSCSGTDDVYYHSYEKAKKDFDQIVKNVSECERFEVTMQLDNYIAWNDWGFRGTAYLDEITQDDFED